MQEHKGTKMRQAKKDLSRENETSCSREEMNTLDYLCVDRALYPTGRNILKNKPMNYTATTRKLARDFGVF